MHTLFLLNPTAGKTDGTQQLPQQINAAAARAGLAPEEYTIRITTHAGHARELARAAAAGAQQAGEPLRIFTAGGDGTFNEALTGAYGFAGTAVGCLPYGSGNDFLRTFGTREEFLDLDAQLAGGAVPIDLMETNLGLSATICAAGLDAQVAYGIPNSGASRCAAGRCPIRCPLWGSCAGTSAAGWSTPSTVRSLRWTV